MPELPEVETVRTALSDFLLDQTIQSVDIRCRRLRYPIQKNFSQLLQHKKFHQIKRRGKYLLFYCHEKGGLIWHLGMSGAMRLVDSGISNNEIRRHDHLLLRFKKRILCFNDPRRFGFVHWSQDFSQDPFLLRLGPEPLSSAFNANYFYQTCHRKHCAIKQAVMDHTIVAGVGNIYANEALFHANIHPFRVCATLTLSDYKVLVGAIKMVLKKAIKAGGTTLRDFADPDGKPGYFQQQLFVYQRAGLPCLKCQHIITDQVLSNRRAFFCSNCQPT